MMKPTYPFPIQIPSFFPLGKRSNTFSAKPIQHKRKDMSLGVCKEIIQTYQPTGETIITYWQNFHLAFF